MRVLAACSLGGSGHLHPLLPFLKAARQRGHETLVVGPPALRDMVERLGWPFEAGAEPDEADVAPLRERLPVAPPVEATLLGNRELFGRLATAAMLPAMARLCGAWRPDLVVREPCEYSSAVVAFGLGIPTAQVAISLAENEAGSIAMAAPALEEHRRGLVDELLGSPYLTRFPASLDPSSFTVTVRYQEPALGPARPLPDWWRGSEAPLVYVSFGTVLGHMSVATGVYRTALQALDRLPVRALLTVGRQYDASTLGAVPGNVRVETWVEQADVLGHADVVVCHGGSGTAFGALAAAVPVVVVPLFADQFENGRRIATAGAGVVVGTGEHHDDGSRRVIAERDAPRIAQAVETVLGESSYRTAARGVATEITAAAPVDSVLDSLLQGIV